MRISTRSLSIAAAAVVIMGIAGCSGSGVDTHRAAGSSSSTPPAASRSSSATAGPASADQTPLEACSKLAGLAKYQSELQSTMSAAQSDPTAALAELEKLQGVYESLASEIGNPTIKPKVQAVSDDFGAFVADMKTVQANPTDTAASSTLLTDLQSMQSAALDLEQTCTTAAG